MRTIAAALAFCAVASLLPSAARADDTPVRRTVDRTAPGAPRVRVDDPVGDVKITGDNGTTVRVTARIHANDEKAANDVAVDAARRGDETAVTVTIAHQSRGFWQVFDRRRISVDLLVSVPRASALSAHLATGDLDVRGVAAAIDAHVSTGDARLHDATGSVAVSAGTGDVLVELASAWSGPRLSARSGTGDIQVRVPAGLRARVETHTGLGDVRNDLRGTNVSSPVIEAHSGIGDITIRTR
jgi:DUF4097 and DUF4098 domain-containing protein YvlB